MRAAALLFNVEQDLGTRLTGYVVLNGFEGSARIRAFARDRLVYEGDADSPRPPIAAAGRHRTGLCGFELDEIGIPGLAGMIDLEIHEAGNGTLIYRRPRPLYAQRRVLRLESHLYPLWRMDRALNGAFQYHANQIEALGRETTSQMLLLNGIESVYLSGHLLYRAFQNLLEGHFDVVFAMHHPYEELAERLIVLSQIKTTGSNILGLRENMSLAPVMAFAQGLPLGDGKALARALRDMPLPVARVFANPVVRQLTVSTPEEMPTRGSLSAALSALSAFKLVGLRRAPRAFAQAMAELVGQGDPAPFHSPQLPGVAELARMLKRSGEVDWLIEQDLALYRSVAEAYRSAAAADTFVLAHDV